LIIVYTDFDNTTKVLSSYAETLLRQFGVQFLRVLKPPADSVSDAVRQELAQAANAGKPLFFFGHGYDIPPSLYGQDKQPFVSDGHWNLLKDRVLCAICCHAVESIAPLVAGMNTTIVGFRGALQVPWNAPYKDLMESSVLAAPNALLAGSDVQTAKIKAEAAFRELARLLMAKDHLEDQIHGAFMEMNADIVGFCGDGDRKLS
jgi:hypothetical protein